MRISESDQKTSKKILFSPSRPKILEFPWSIDLCHFKILTMQLMKKKEMEQMRWHREANAEEPRKEELDTLSIKS